MLVYGILGFLRPAVYVFLWPFYMSVFTVEENGLYYLMIAVAGVAMLVIGLRLSSAMLTYYYNYYQDQETLRDYLRSSFSTSIILSVLFLIVLYFIGPSLFDYVFQSDEIQFYPYGFTVCIYAALTEINMNYYIYLRNEKSLGKYAFVVVFQTVAVILFQILFICYYGMGVQGALLGMTLGWVLLTLVIIFMERDILTLRPNLELVKPALKFSIALLPYLIIYWLLIEGGKFFLESKGDLALVGVFANLMVLTRFIILGVEAIINGIRPFLFEQFSKGSKRNDAQVSLLTKMIINVPLLAIPFVILVGTNVHFFTSNEAFYAINQYITLASFVVFVFVYIKLFYQQLIFIKKSGLITLLSFAAVVALIGFFILWIPKYQINGVLYATLVGNAILALLFFVSAQKLAPVKYELRSILFVPLITFICIFSLEYFLLESGYSYANYGWIQFFIISILLLLLNFKNFKEYRLLFIKSKS